MLKTLYSYLSKIYFLNFLIFLSITVCVIGLFELLDFIQKYLAHTVNDPMVIFWRCVRHVHQFFPYLLFIVFSYTMRMVIQKNEFNTLQNLGVSPLVFLKVAGALVGILFLFYYFIYTPLQRLAYDISFRPDNALNSSLLAPSGLWLLEGGHTKRFIKARSYDKNTHTLHDVQILDMPPQGQPVFHTHCTEKFHFPADFYMAKQDYFPFINLWEKVRTLQNTGFSTVDYRLIWHKFWFLPLYWLGLAFLGFLFAYFIKSHIYFFLTLLGCAILLFFIYEIAISFVMAEKILVIPTLSMALLLLYGLCGGYYVGYTYLRR